MSSNLGVGKILDLLERLRGTVRDFAARAEKLNAEFYTRTGREQRLREAAEEKQATELAAAIGEAEAAFAAAREAAQAKYEARKAWIGKAYQASKEKAPGGHRDPDRHPQIRTAEEDAPGGARPQLGPGCGGYGA